MVTSVTITNRLCHLSLCCLPVETACKLFGAISFLLSAFGLFMLIDPDSIAHTIMEKADFNTWPDTWDEASGNIDMAAYILVLFLQTFTVSSFVFSALLVYGTEKRRVVFLKAYMAYGAVMSIFVMLGLTYCYITSWLLTDEGCLIGFISSFIYLRVLFMVGQTHDMFRAEKDRDRAHLLPLCKTA